MWDNVSELSSGEILRLILGLCKGFRGSEDHWSPHRDFYETFSLRTWQGSWRKILKKFGLPFDCSLLGVSCSRASPHSVPSNWFKWPINDSRVWDRLDSPVFPKFSVAVLPCNNELHYWFSDRFKKVSFSLNFSVFQFVLWTHSTNWGWHLPSSLSTVAHNRNLSPRFARKRESMKISPWAGQDRKEYKGGTVWRQEEK